MTTWYVDGNAYTGTQLIEQPIPHGQYYRSAGVYRYQLTDHTGSVRAIINRNKLSNGHADVLYHADYYPFGSVLQSAGIPSRYGYQGEYAEKDNETGWNNFYLRNYDPAIGRWLSTDPYGQYHSPYVGMGNNPVMGFDADGGWSWFGAATRWIGAKVSGQNPGEITKRFDGEYGFYTQKVGGSGDNVTVTGGANFDSEGTVGNTYLHMVNNAWRRSEVFAGMYREHEYPMHFNEITGEFARMPSHMHTGAVTAIYPEADFIGGIPKATASVGWRTLGLALKTTKNVKKASGAYLLEFESGNYYAGKGLKPRMSQSINRIEIQFGDKLLKSTFYPARNTRSAFIKEYKLMKSIGLPRQQDPNSLLYNKIWSPGKKISGY